MIEKIPLFLQYLGYLTSHDSLCMAEQQPGVIIGKQGPLLLKEENSANDCRDTEKKLVHVSSLQSVLEHDPLGDISLV